MGAFRVFASIATLCSVPLGVGAIQLPRSSEDEAVCISMVVYEPADWIDLMLANAFSMSEQTTKVALHLDAKTKYSEEDIKRWSSMDRVAVTSERVEVKPFWGSILYAHLANAQSMADKWDNDCKYFVLQASNMMWVRQGMEKQVRARRFSPFSSHAKGHGCAERHGESWSGFTDKLGAPKELYGWGQPEGSFFPFEDVMNAQRMMKDWIHEKGDDKSLIADARCYFENTWLQTYMLNYAKLPEDPDSYSIRHHTPLSRNAIHYGDKENDVVPFDVLEKVRDGAEGFEEFYAVKRVNRNLLHSTTQYIARLSGFVRH